MTCLQLAVALLVLIGKIVIEASVVREKSTKRGFKPFHSSFAAYIVFEGFFKPVNFNWLVPWTCTCHWGNLRSPL